MKRPRWTAGNSEPTDHQIASAQETCAARANSSNNRVYQNVIKEGRTNDAISKPLVYIENESNKSIANAGQVILVNCTDITVEGLNATHVDVGLELWLTNNTIVTESTFMGNLYGIMMYNSAGNSFYHNNFINNTQSQVYFLPDSAVLPNVWDYGHLSGGNYWSNYVDTDTFSGPGQNVSGSDGIWDHACVIDANNTDRYPLVSPWVQKAGLVVRGMDNRIYYRVWNGASWEGWNVLPGSTMDSPAARAARYTIEFGKLGFDVTLLNLSSEMLEIAKSHVERSGVKKRVRSIIHGSIDDLSIFENETFDAVVCLGGPLSHVVDEVRREKGIDELIRVGKKGCLIFISVIGRSALLVSELVNFPEEIELNIFEKIRGTGDYEGGYGFAPCHFYLPEELKKSFQKRGIRVLETVGLEGLASGHRRETNRLARKYLQAWKIWWTTPSQDLHLSDECGNQ